MKETTHTTFRTAYSSAIRRGLDMIDLETTIYHFEELERLEKQAFWFRLPYIVLGFAVFVAGPIALLWIWP